jgi:hypothetical protein
VLSDEYAALWDGGEAWCQELEVYHNPMASNPIDFALLPGATHWFETSGEVVCSTMWENSVLSSITHLNVKRRKTKFLMALEKCVLTVPASQMRMVVVVRNKLCELLR